MTTLALFGRALMIVLSGGVCLVPVSPAGARSLSEIRAAGVVSCAGTVRPGLALPATGGKWRGLEADICRAVAVAVLGSAGPTRFQSYGTTADPVASAQPVDIAFLTASEMLARPHLEQVLPGPPVFVITHAVAVVSASPVRHLAELGPALICVEPGTGTERALGEFIHSHAMSARMFMFQEDEERLDAFQGGRCDAVAGEAPNLAAMAAGMGNSHWMRLLPEPIAAVPIYATTSNDDARWASVVAWTIHTLMANDSADAARLPLDLTALDLAPDWQARVFAAVGSYADIFDRNLGDQSPLGLPRGLTASWSNGGTSVPPYTE